VIAALFVQTNGAYFGRDDVDPWDESADARNYAGPFPVVAHPPCARWSKLAKLVESQHGYKVGADGGCFASALASVRRWGGVLEHPAFSLAWPAHGLPRPVSGTWQATPCGGWVTSVAQVAYGHRAHKDTWLYAHTETEPAPLLWLHEKPQRTRRTVESMGKRERSATPPEFRDLLISIARGSR
jgi:hypothetical protein